METSIQLDRSGGMGMLGTNLLVLPYSNAIEVTDTSERHKTNFGELRSFNSRVEAGQISISPPLNPGPVHIYLEPPPRNYTEGLLDLSSGTFKLYNSNEAISTDDPVPSRDGSPELASAIDPRFMMDQLLAIVEKGSAADLEMFLASMQLDREIALERLRRLAEIHRDAVQNAVDILQTKRIDFLENPQEAGIEGPIMAFIVAAIAGVVITSVVGAVVELVATGVFSIIGRLERKKANEIISAFINRRQSELEVEILWLKDVQRRFVPENARTPLKSKSRLQHLFKEKIGALKKEIGQAKMEKRLLLQGLLEDSMVRAKALRARLKDPIKKADGGTDNFHKYGQLAIQKATEAVSAVPTAVTQTKADSSVRTTAMPLDVAMKLEVHEYFDPWLVAAEDSIRFIKQARLFVSSVGMDLLSDKAIVEILALVASSGALDQFTKDVSSLTVGSVDLRTDLTSFYELLLWLTMYRPRLSKVNRLLLTGGIFTDHRGRLPELKKVLPKGDKGTMNLLRYLALRFFGLGKITGEGEAAEITFSDDDLLSVHIKTEELCAKLFTPQPAQTTGKKSDDLDEALLRSLESVRFVVMPYEKK